MGIFRHDYPELPPNVIVEAGGDIFDPVVIGLIYDCVAQNDVALVREAAPLELVTDMADILLDKYYWLRCQSGLEPDVLRHMHEVRRHLFDLTERTEFDTFQVGYGEDDIVNYLPYDFASGVHEAIVGNEPPARLDLGCEVVNLLSGNVYEGGQAFLDHRDDPHGLIYSLDVEGVGLSHLYGRRLGGSYRATLYPGDMLVLPSSFGPYKQKPDQTGHGILNITPDDGERLTLNFGCVPDKLDPADVQYGDGY